MKNKIKAFSLSETIIILTVLAVAIAASIPIMTKKMVNVSDAGSTITGASHGRYEIFSKEIITIEVPNEDGKYEKTTKPPKDSNKIFGGGKDSDIVVFRRLYDEEYIKVTNTVPALSKNGKYKSTLYEQIKDVTPIRNSDGEITFVEYKKLGVTKKVPVGGNIIVENANLVYKKGCLDTSDGVSEFTQNGEKRQDKSTCNATGSGADELPSDVARIIEGNFAKRCYKKTHHDLEGVTCDKLDNDANDLWLVRVKSEADLNPNFELKDETIPWERIYSGPEPIVDRPIPKDPDTGEYIGTFDPGEKAINVVVHAVGGGGAGGGLGDPGSAISPKELSSKQLDELKKELAQRFNEVNGTSLKVDEIVSITNDPNYHLTNKDDGTEDFGSYITINTANGTITGKVNVRIGYYRIFPHQLFDYTKTLGSASQKGEIYDMPIWGNWQNIYEKDFRVAAVGCGCAGGGFPGYTIVDAKDLDCLAEHYCPAAPISCECLETASCCSGSFKSMCPTKNGGQSPCNWSCDIHNNGSCTFKIGRYKACIKTIWHQRNPLIKYFSQCPGEVACEENRAKWTGASYTHEFLGASGGAAPGCGVACHRVSGPISVGTNCDNFECAGKSGSATSGAKYGSTVIVTAGQNGRSCYMQAGGSFATSQGGKGAKPCSQPGYKLQINPDDPTNSDFKDVPQNVLDKAMGEMAMGDRAAAAELLSPYVSTDNPGYTMDLLDSYSYAQAAGTYDTSADTEISIQSMADGTYIYTGDDAPGVLANYVTNLQGAGMQVKPIEMKTQHMQTDSWVCGAIEPYQCGIPGEDGTAISSCGGSRAGINMQPGKGGGGKYYYNHIYLWTMPYKYNQLTYGEAGQAGEYKTTKIAKVDKPLQIKLGRGGVWKTPAPSETPDWEKGTKGPDGTDTVIKIGDDFASGKVKLIAKGGKGGSQKQMTDKYDLCYPYENAGVCKNNSASTKCCNNEKGTRSTRDIISTALNLSAFENIKSLVGNSLIIGTGTGRGGEGIGTRAGLEEVGDDRYFMNASAWNLSNGNRIVLHENNKAEDGTYENKVVSPSEHNFRGGDGAVIITW